MTDNYDMDGFDWEGYRERSNPLKYRYVLNYHDKEISEERFVSDWRQFRPFSTLHLIKGRKDAGVSRKISTRYSRSSLRKQYRWMRDNYGFFTGNNETKNGAKKNV